MFDDVPQDLHEMVQSVVRNFYKENVRMYGICMTIAAYYLQEDPERTSNRVNEDPQKYGITMTRTAMLGVMLFSLRNEPGFPEMCNRLRGRDIRSTYFECLSAATFQRKGFEIHARGPTYQKKKDFDFQARLDGVPLAVEVTSLTAPEFTKNTIKNALAKKRKQLPINTAGYIDLYYPVGWDTKSGEIREEILEIAGDFIRQTERVNYVNISREEAIERPPGLIYLISGRLLINLKTRVQCPTIERQFETEKLPLNYDGLQMMNTEKTEVSGSAEFQSYVDYVLATT